MGALLFSGVRAATAAPSARTCATKPDHKETPMAYPTNRTIKTVDLTAYSPSVGATPVAAYVRIPFRCQIAQASSVLGGAITTADSLVACAVNGGAGLPPHPTPPAGPCHSGLSARRYLCQRE